MHRAARTAPILFALAVASLPATAFADIVEVAKCQKTFAREGAKFAQRVIKGTLRCTNEIAECQIQCEEGVYGPPCDPNPAPGCCDPDDPSSNGAFQTCMTIAQAVCDIETAKIDDYEAKKVDAITKGCIHVSPEELCGAQTPGLNFATLNAGCQALNPGYTCDLTNLINCVGGPLMRQLLDQLSATLDPRAGEAVATLNLTSAFPDIPIARKVTGQVAPGKTDVWALTGQAGDQIVVKVTTRDDNGNDTSNLQPRLTLLENDGVTTVVDTTVRSVPCAFPNVCGGSCSLFKRSLPFSGTFRLAVSACTSTGCTGGKYRLVVTSPGGVVPTLVQDDVSGPGC
jgi:hypothetical protein